MNWLLVVAGWLLGLGYAQAQPFASLGNHAKTTRFETGDDLCKLVNTLIAPAQTDLEKARALFVWVAANVHYDDRNVKSYRFGYAVKSIDTLSAAASVLRSRQGVCTDYSLLLYQLLKSAGLPARIITGYAKGQPDQAGTPIRSINHQWNMVFLDDRWQPLDATWASTNKGTRPLNMYYFLTPPAQFSADHFSMDTDELLPEQSMTKAEFDALPRIYNSYFTLGFGQNFPRQGLYQINRRLQFSVENAADMEFVIQAHRFGQPQNERTVYYRAFRQKTGYDLTMQVFRDGVYSVHVLSRPKGDMGDYQLILTFTVISGTKS